MGETDFAGSKLVEVDSALLVHVNLASLVAVAVASLVIENPDLLCAGKTI